MLAADGDVRSATRRLPASMCGGTWPARSPLLPVAQPSSAAPIPVAACPAPQPAYTETQMQQQPNGVQWHEGAAAAQPQPRAQPLPPRRLPDRLAQPSVAPRELPALTLAQVLPTCPHPPALPQNHGRARCTALFHCRFCWSCCPKAQRTTHIFLGISRCRETLLSPLRRLRLTHSRGCSAG